jgi:hypothetical protein
MTLIDSDYFEANMTQLGLKATFAPKDAVLDQLIEDASDWVVNYLRRVVEPTEIVETVKGKGFNRLILDQYPIISLTSVEYDDDSGPSGEVDTDNVRPLYNGMLEWKRPYSHGPWRAGRTYTVTYTAGYAEIPSAIKRATAIKVVDLFSPQYQGARDARSVEQVTKLEELMVDLLEPYRRERIG